MEFAVHTNSQQGYFEGFISYKHGEPTMITYTLIKGQIVNGESTKLLVNQQNKSSEFKNKIEQAKSHLEEEYQGFSTKYTVLSEDGRIFVLSQKDTDSNTKRIQHFMVHEIKEDGSLTRIPVSSAINPTYETRCKCDSFVISTPTFTIGVDEGAEGTFTVNKRNLKLAKIH